MKKNKYIRCTIKDDGKTSVDLNANDKELIEMACAIVYSVSAALGIDIEKLCAVLFTASKIITVEDKKEEKNNENH